jgi:DNA-binding NtrC family response regulator
MTTQPLSLASARHRKPGSRSHTFAKRARPRFQPAAERAISTDFKGRGPLGAEDDAARTESLDAIAEILPSAAVWKGSCPVTRLLLDRVDKLASARGDVLIEGESGSGKDLVAREIARRSARASEPFVAVDCAGLTASQVESELFGHAAGATSDGALARAGVFELARGGTVFLHEVAELPIDVQAKLLRVLTTREVRRQGENRARAIDVRVLAATNRQMEQEISAGRFREDLYFRLAGLRVEVPPLRERLEDVPVLIDMFLERLGQPERRAAFTERVLEELGNYHWPGNVRELGSFVERFVLLGDLEIPGASPKTRPGSEASAPLPNPQLSVPFREAKRKMLEHFERTYLTELLSASRGNVSSAARRAQVDRMYLHRLLRRYGIRRDEAAAE